MNDVQEIAALQEHAPAKINLFLHVDRPRSDGYHELESLVVFTDFGDRVWITASDTLSLERSGPFASALPADPQDDLCLRAARALGAVFNRDEAVHIALEKNIPVAAGIGGGSTDAAAVLRALCRMWKIDAAETRVGDVAAGLGADVPVCLGARTALIGGTGEIVVPLVTAPELHLLLVNPSRPLSTAAVFNAYPGPPQAFQPVQDEFAGLQGPAMVSRVSEHRNDLRAAACELCPDIRDVLGALGSAPECRLARMSGSGPTCFGVFETSKACDKAAEVIAGGHPDWWVRGTRTRG